MVRYLSVPALLVAFAAAGCGSATREGAASPTATTAAAPANTTASSGPGALQAEANAAAAGDIPDNQVFLVFRNAAARYTVKYPEGWAQQGAGGSVTFRDKNNIVRVVVDRGPPPTKKSVRADVSRLHANATAQVTTISGAPTFKVTYRTVSAPNAVTGKRVELIVDRYYLWKGGRRAVIDLGTPRGVDNVDAYRMMIESFRWG